MDTKPLSVAVIGAGIAGLMTAAAMRKAGIGARVYEQATRLAEVGAGIQISPNAVRILHDHGLADRLAADGVRVVAVEMRRWRDGALICRTPLADACEERFGAPYYTIHRADLHSALVSLLPADSIRLNARCSGIHQESDSVRIAFTGSASVTASAVVGADGIRSSVRASVVSDAARFSGQVMYRGVVPADRVTLFDKPKVVLWLGPGRHCVAYPVSGGRLISFAATTPGWQWDGESWTARGTVADLVSAYRDWHRSVRTLFEAADSVGRFALHDRDPLTAWGRGRVTLAGDAAHPMLPFMAQGANQAIEDAAALADCLAADEVLPALRRYERLRMARTGEIQRGSRGSTDSFHLPDSAEQRARDRTLADKQGLEHRDWLYAYDPVPS